MIKLACKHWSSVHLFTLWMVVLVSFPSLILIQGGSQGGSSDLEPTREEVEGVPEYDLNLRIPDLPPSQVMLAPSEFLAAAQPLARHRTRMGLPTALYSIDDIESNISGEDRERKVHNFLRTIHQMYPSFNWLLIIGDSEHLMPRPLWHYALDRGQFYQNYYYSDMYYAGLDSTWDTDGDGRYGEFSNMTYTVDGDLDSDVYVGRVPASDVDDVTNYVEKLIRYEKNPPVGTWMKRFLNWGSVMEAPNNIEVGSEYRYMDYRSNAYKVCTKVGEGLPGHLIEKPLYDYPQMEGGNYTVDDGRDTLNRNNMLSWLNTGASLLNFAGQARYAGYALNDYGPPTCNDDADNYVWNEPIRYSDDALLTNGDMVPFMYLSTCNSASFHFGDATLERFVTSQNGGAIGFISSTGTSYRGEERSTSWGNWYLDERYWEIFLNEGVTRPGQALDILKADYRQAWFGDQLPALRESVLGMMYAYVLIGDPYVDIYTDEAVWFKDPAQLGIKWYSGEHDYSVRVLDHLGDPIPNPRLTIYDPHMYQVISGDGDGWANFTLDLSLSARINVTFTGHNAVQTSKQYDVLPEISDIAIMENRIDISDPTPVHGDMVTITVPVKNIGGMVSTDSKLHVSYVGGDGDPTYKVARHDLGDIQVDEEMLVSWNWTVRAGTHGFQLVAQTSSLDLDPENNIAWVRFNTTGPDLSFSPGTGRFEPDDVVRPGAVVTVHYSIYNQGAASGEVDIGVFNGNPQEGGIPIGELLGRGPVQPGEYLNGSLTFTSPHNSSMISMVMDHYGEYPPDMIDRAWRSLLLVNYPPILLGSPTITMQEDSSPSSLALDGFFDDVDDPEDLMEYSLISSPIMDSRLKAWEERGTLLTVIPPGDWFGDTEVIIGVDDGLGRIDVTIPVSVSPVNDPPTFPQAPLGEMDLVVLEDTRLSITLVAADIEGDTVTFSTEDEEIELDIGSGEIVWDPVQDDVGSHVFEIIASDGNGGSSLMRILVEVKEVNEGPLVEPLSDLSCKIGEILTFQVFAMDEEGDNLTYSSDVPFIIMDESGRGSINATPGSEGTLNVTVEVRDGVNSIYVSFNLVISSEGGEDGGEGSFDIQMIMAAGGIALAVFGILFLGLRGLKRGGGDEEVEQEKRAADSLYGEERAEVDRKMPRGEPEEGQE